MHLNVQQRSMFHLASPVVYMSEVYNTLADTSSPIPMHKMAYYVSYSLYIIFLVTAQIAQIAQPKLFKWGRTALQFPWAVLVVVRNTAQRLCCVASLYDKVSVVTHAYPPPPHTHTHTEKD